MCSRAPPTEEGFLLADPARVGGPGFCGSQAHRARRGDGLLVVRFRFALAGLPGPPLSDN